MKVITEKLVSLAFVGPTSKAPIPDGLCALLEALLKLAQLNKRATFNVYSEPSRVNHGKIIEVKLAKGYLPELEVNLAPMGKGSARFGRLLLHDTSRGWLQSLMPNFREAVNKINRYSSLRKLLESHPDLCDNGETGDSGLVFTSVGKGEVLVTKPVLRPAVDAPAHNPHSQSNAEEVWNDAGRLQRFAAEMLKFPDGFVPIEVLKTEIAIQLDIPEQLLAKTVIKLSDAGYCTMCKVDGVIGFTFNAQPPSKPYPVKPKVDNTSRVEVNPDTILAFIVSTLSDGQDEIQVPHAEFTAKMREYFGLVDNPQASGWVMKRVLASGYVQKRLVDKIPFCFVYRSPVSTVLANKQQPEASAVITADMNSEVKRPVGRPKKVVGNSDALSMIENIKAKIAEVQGSLKALTDEVAQLTQLLQQNSK